MLYQVDNKVDYKVNNKMDNKKISMFIKINLNYCIEAKSMKEIEEFLNIKSRQLKNKFV